MPLEFKTGTSPDEIFEIDATGRLGVKFEDGTEVVFVVNGAVASDWTYTLELSPDGREVFRPVIAVVAALQQAVTDRILEGDLSLLARLNLAEQVCAYDVTIGSRPMLYLEIDNIHVELEMHSTITEFWIEH